VFLLKTQKKTATNVSSRKKGKKKGGVTEQ